MTGEVDISERNLRECSDALALECDRMQKIADYVNASDYCDSIGPILEAIDREKDLAFRAGLEAAAKEVWENWDETESCCDAIRSLKRDAKLPPDLMFLVEAATEYRAASIAYAEAIASSGVEENIPHDRLAAAACAMDNALRWVAIR
jgi:hypothetical protein